MKVSLGQVAISSLKGFCWLAFPLFASATLPAFAQSSGQDGVEPWVDYHKQIEGAEHMAALDEGFSGEAVSLYDGATTFSVADIAVPGNFALPVQLVRRISIELQDGDDNITAASSIRSSPAARAPPTSFISAANCLLRTQR